MEARTMNLKKALIVVSAILLLAPQAFAAKKSRSARYKAHLSQGADSMNRRDYKRAVRHFANAARAQKKAEAYFLLGYAHYQKAFVQGVPEAADRREARWAVNAFDIAFSLDPDMQTVKSPYRIYHSMALCYEALGKNDRAIDAYRKAFRAQPDNPMLPLYAARLRYRMNDGPRAAANLALALRKARATRKQRALVKMIKTDPFFSPMMKSELNRNIVAEYEPAPAARQAIETDLRDAVRDDRGDQRAQILMEQQTDSAVLRRLAASDEEYKFRRFRDAVAGYNETLLLNQEAGTLNATQLSMIYERMGTAYNQLGLSNGAIKALRYSIQEMPGNAKAHYQLALAYAVSGKYSASLKALGRALKNAPTNAERKKLSLLARVDVELEPIRDLPGFKSTISPYMGSFQARR